MIRTSARPLRFPLGRESRIVSGMRHLGSRRLGVEDMAQSGAVTSFGVSIFWGKLAGREGGMWASARHVATLTPTLAAIPDLARRGSVIMSEVSRACQNLA